MQRVRIIAASFAAASILGCVPAAAAGEGSPPPQRTFTVSVTAQEPAVIAEEQLRVELVDVKDGRCPSNVTCVWAGHASVTLKVTIAGAEPGKVQVGTRAPASMNLPFEADLGKYRFALVALSPGRRFGAALPTERYRATLAVTRR